jgi:aminopeptidase N
MADQFDPEARTYTLSISQKIDPTPNEADKQPLVLPVRFSLIGPNGSAMGWEKVSGGDVRGDLIVVDTERVTLRFEGIANRPIPSLFRQFSAPVVLRSSLSQEDQLFLARHDDDPFNRWQSLQDVAMALMAGAVAGSPPPETRTEALAAALDDTIKSDSLDPAFKANTLALPGETLIARTIGANVDPDRIRQVRRALLGAVAGRIGHTLEATYRATAIEAPYSPDFRQAGQRALRNAVLSLLVSGETPVGAELAREQYESAGNMTDRVAALGAAVVAWTPEAASMLEDFHQRFTADPLVLDKWLSLNAVAPDEGVINRLSALLSDPNFPRNNPNRLRSLMGSFGMNNPTQFARADGAGFRFVGSFVADVDKRNPQVAARVLTAFRVWQSYEPTRRAAAEGALRSLQESGELSRNTSDILARTLNG